MKKWSLWRWLFHRHTQPKPVDATSLYAGIDPCVTPAWSAMMWRGGWYPGWQSTYWQAINDSLSPEMYAPDVKPKRTKHITQIIDAETRKLPPVVDCDAPTEAVPGWQFYAEDTMRVVCVDEYATQPMEMAVV